MTRGTLRFAAVAGSLLWLAGAAGAGAADKTVAEEILDILRSEGRISEQQYQALSERARAEAQQTPPVSAAADSYKVYWKNGLRIEDPEKKHKIKLGGRLMADYAHFNADDEVVSLLGDPDLDGGSGTEFRRARLEIDGTLFERFDFKAQYDFADAGSAEIKDLWVRLKGVPLVGNVMAGHFKEPFSLEEITSSKYITFMERSLINDAFTPGRSVGVMIHDAPLQERMTWSLGAFRADTDDSGFSFGEDHVHSVGARVTGLPWYADEGTRLLHVGLSYQHQLTDDDASLRFRARPEAHLSPVRFVDTGAFTGSDGVHLIAPELALVHGPFSLQGEYARALVDNGGLDDPELSGHYVEASWFLTGESRVYDTGDGAFDRVTPKRNFDMEGGLGAWQLALRWSGLELDDEGLAGGELESWTVGLNWHLNPVLRVMFNYVHADLERGGIDADTDVLQTRLQIDF